MYKRIKLTQKISVCTLLLFLSSCDIINEYLPTVTESGIAQGFSGDLLQTIDRQAPVSTQFKDARYEAVSLGYWEPAPSLYRPLAAQPVNQSGEYKLESGLYTMETKSFCLKGYTHGPSSGDGHLYAPLRGRKSSFVTTILERYAQKPTIPQKNIQMLLWAVVVGANMDDLSQQHQETLNELFDYGEQLNFKGRDWIGGIADEQYQKLRAKALQNASPKLRSFIEADNQIASLLQGNKTYQEIERIAVLPGLAPANEMIREVSKGRWSYHPDGYFLRFFPNGYQNTRLDVYVPFVGEVNSQNRRNVQLLDLPGYRKVQTVVVNPAKMVAVPANQASQRIGQSAVPNKPIPAAYFPEKNCDPDSIFDAGLPRFSKMYDGLEIRGSKAFINLTIDALTTIKRHTPSYYDYYIRPETNDSRYPMKGVGIDCHRGSNTIDAFRYARLLIKTQKDYEDKKRYPELLGSIILHEAVHLRQADAHMSTIGYGKFNAFLRYYSQNPSPFEREASKKQLDFLNVVRSKNLSNIPFLTEIDRYITFVKKYRDKDHSKR